MKSCGLLDTLRIKVRRIEVLAPLASAAEEDALFDGA